MIITDARFRESLFLTAVRRLNDERQIDTAERLYSSKSMVSSVESCTRKMPRNWFKRFEDEYDLTDALKANLRAIKMRDIDEYCEDLGITKLELRELLEDDDIVVHKLYADGKLMCTVVEKEVT